MRVSQGTQTTADQVAAAVSVLQQGGVVAFPTDTLYALGAHGLMESALRRVCEIKGRPDGMALPLLLAGAGGMEQVVTSVPQVAWDLAERFWPGALSLVLPCGTTLSPLVTGGGKTVALRVPDHSVALELLRMLDAPVTGTSANRSGGPDPTSAQVVREQLPTGPDLVLDGGASPLGRASTLLDLTGNVPRILRQGVISALELERVCPGLEIGPGVPSASQGGKGR